MKYFMQFKVFCLEMELVVVVTSLMCAGMKVSNSTFTSLVQRYSHKDGKIYFDDYIHCIARLRTMFGEFCPFN